MALFLVISNPSW